MTALTALLLLLSNPKRNQSSSTLATQQPISIVLSSIPTSITLHDEIVVWVVVVEEVNGEGFPLRDQSVFAVFFSDFSAEFVGAYRAANTFDEIHYLGLLVRSC